MWPAKSSATDCDIYLYHTKLTVMAERLLRAAGLYSIYSYPRLCSKKNHRVPKGSYLGNPG